MKAKNLFALALTAALGAAIPAAYADSYHGNGHNYRYDHRDYRGHDRWERERHMRHDYRVYHREPRYVVERPVYVQPPVQYSAPSGFNIVLPIQF